MTCDECGWIQVETGERFTDDILLCIPGGVHHDPQRYMRKTVNVPHFNPDTVEYAPRERDDRIKTRDQNTASFSEKHYGRERFGQLNFQDVMVTLDACY